MIGWAVGGGSVELGLQAMVWGAVLRIFLFQHATWAVNSVCHRFGSRDFKTRDESRNNLAVAMLTFGEGWHNNHHAFPASARHGLLPHQFDLTARRREAARALARDLGREAARRQRARAPPRSRRLILGRATGAFARASRVECDPLDLSSGGT